MARSLWSTGFWIAIALSPVVRILILPVVQVFRLLPNTATKRRV
jgi:hypothetical protein